MRVSGLTASGDWRFGRGKANYKKGSDAIGQNIVTRLRSFKRDWFLDIEANVDWLRLLGSKGVRLETIRKAVERVVQSTEGVARVDSVVVNFDRVSREVAITVDCVDVFNTRQLLEGITL